MEQYEESLSDFFSDIVYVDSNKSILETIDIYKENGEIKRVHKKQEVNLEERILVNKTIKNLMAPECRSYGIIDLIRKNSKRIDLNLYPKNIIHDLFRSKAKIKEVFNLPEDHFIISSPKAAKIIKKYTKNKIHIIDSCDEFEFTRLEKYIIIGKKSKIIIKKNLDKEQDFESVIAINLSLNYNYFYTVSLF